ncbi:hypothetical protein [Lentilactobacillus parabuchneri]|uniref:Uncharacterized protein n=1 Tax=Lentilactobacillus parabuchneri TaxID=152331 RepID=A0A844EHZ7_9LACO|nr:hypothetical protein [Lentilactobacillus parabuchneri]MDB1104706.1 hypothetical protein [Lentilactobacillus parabuchneri]MSE19756.1 hypothetical protein [Lentilactobacillus parabuchneri]
MKRRIVEPRWTMSGNFLFNVNAIAFVEKVDPNILKTHMLNGEVISVEYTGKGDPLEVYAKYLAGVIDDENS